MANLKASLAPRAVLARTCGHVNGCLTHSAILLGVACPWIRLRGRHGTVNDLRWYQLVYRAIYRAGLIIWRRAAPPVELVDLIEGPGALPAGRALDLGCGTGTDTIYLATHGWNVTAVDMVPKALAIGRHNATVAGVAARFVQGDVTRLDELGVGDGYTLILDFGCFHTLPEDRRPAYVTGVSHAAPAATLLLYGFRRPPRTAPMHAGMSVEEVKRRFIGAGWELVEAKPSVVKPMLISRAEGLFELWHYQLRRTPR
ncbi:class I SAM-dependent methyltransferase [Mycobacterium nebraskense]|uniref:class I SAM-dependent methyltransferase n=1 Tax=Mycobacterium nebraskense TaxID=244292 RepID=UPI0009E20A6F|nr:class I SAM-dependent methyltransferase [Mycobacterium nebraskense]MBI2694880.1 methyltransferase domain-containing protein [Mycobacterium nebraskense]MCV7116389.1 methyltransferase domain-containing protein [Mycobacterium nebraskense]